MRNPTDKSFYIARTLGHPTVENPSERIVAGGNGAGLSNDQLQSPEGVAYDGITDSLIIDGLGSHTLVRWMTD